MSRELCGRHDGQAGDAELGVVVTRYFVTEGTCSAKYRQLIKQKDAVSSLLLGHTT